MTEEEENNKYKVIEANTTIFVLQERVQYL